MGVFRGVAGRGHDWDKVLMVGVARKGRGWWVWLGGVLLVLTTGDGSHKSSH